MRILSVLRPVSGLRRLTKTLAVTAAVTGMLGTTVAHAEPTGIDVSRWQHGTSIDWAKVKSDGVTFAFIKATEGSYYTNSYLRPDWAATRDVGIYRGAYHFARPSKGSAAQQARFFVSQAGKHGRVGDLPPVLDLEDDGGLSDTALRRWTRTWLRTVQELTGRKPIIYTGVYFWIDEMGNTTGFSSYPLWIAHYTTGGPTVPGGWSDWTFWQRTDQGRITGISGNVDINRFNGTRRQLARLAQARPADGESGADAGGDTGGDTGDGAGTGTTPEPGTDVPTEPETPTEPTEPTPDEVAPTPTAVSLNVADDTVFEGQQVDVAGRLRTTTGEALADRQVALYHRDSTERTWTKVAATRTSTTGRYALSLDATTSGTLKVTFAGTRRLAASTSPRRSLTVRSQIRTRPTLAVEDGSRRDNAAKLYGHLRTRAGKPVTNKTMYVFQRLRGTTRWTLVARSHTLSPTGWYQAYVEPRRTADYRAVFRGGVAFDRAVSNVTTVRVR